MLRKIAKVRTEDEYKNALNDLKMSKVWKTHEKLQNWITGIWLKESKVRKLTILRIYASQILALHMTLCRQNFLFLLEMGMVSQKKTRPCER